MRREEMEGGAEEGEEGGGRGLVVGGPRGGSMGVFRSNGGFSDSPWSGDGMLYEAEEACGRGEWKPFSRTFNHRNLLTCIWGPLPRTKKKFAHGLLKVLRP